MIYIGGLSDTKLKEVNKKLVGPAGRTTTGGRQRFHLWGPFLKFGTAALKPLWRWLCSQEVCLEQWCASQLPVAMCKCTNSNIESDIYCTQQTDKERDLCHAAGVIIQVSCSHIVKNHYHLNSCVVSPHTLCHNSTYTLDSRSKVMVLCLCRVSQMKQD